MYRKCRRSCTGRALEPSFWGKVAQERERIKSVPLLTMDSIRAISDGAPAPLRRRVLVISHYFPPERGAGSHRVSAFCRRLVAEGYDVDVLTSVPSFPSGTVPSRYRGKWNVSERDAGIRVRMLWAYASPRMRSVDRMLNQLSFAFVASLAALVTRTKYDLVCVSSPPIVLGIPALLTSYLRNVPLVLDARDVWPDALVRIGEWAKGSLVCRSIGALADALYRRASLIVCVTNSCRSEILSHGVEPSKVVVISNGFDDVQPAVAEPFARNDGEFIASYAGNLGMANGIDVIVHAAALLKEEPSFRFIIVGDGAARRELAALIEREGLSNVTMTGELSRESTLAVQQHSDVCIVPLRRGLHDSLPTKMMDAMALGRPILVCADGEARALAQASGGGVAVDPESPEQLVSALRALAAKPEALQAYGRDGQRYVRLRFDRSKLAAQFCTSVRGVLLNHT